MLLKPTTQKFGVHLILVLGLATLGFAPIAVASNDLVTASRRIAELRAEVEAQNSKWDQLKKSVEAEAQAELGQLLAGDAELKTQRTQIRILEERVRAAKLRLDRGTTVTQTDQPRLTQLVQRLEKLTSTTLSVGRQELVAKWAKLKSSLQSGQATTDEVSGELAELLIQELKLTRGIHYVREELSWESSASAEKSSELRASQVVEGLRVGGIQAWIFTPDARIGRWRGLEQEPEWVEAAAAKTVLLSALQEAREKKTSAYLQLATPVSFSTGESK
jgi:hypothetical protein